MIQVKVCGLTRRDDALHAVEYGADAVGFVFAPRSRRRADPLTVADIVADLPSEIVTVGVFQDQPLVEVREYMAGCGLHVAQLHGTEDLAYMRALGLPVLKAFAPRSPSDVQRLPLFAGQSVFLLDGVDPDGASGGTGHTTDWTSAAAANARGRVVLAGGLTPGNVGEAVRTARPWAVDAASGTEVEPGRKDPRAVRRFVLEAHRAVVDFEESPALSGDKSHDAWGDLVLPRADG